MADWGKPIWNRINTGVVHLGFVPVVTYTASRSGNFTKQCSSGGTTSPVFFEKTYTSNVSQSDANSIADANFNADGQAYADLNGTCTYTVSRTGSFTRNNCPPGKYGSTSSFSKSYSSTISLADANSIADTNFNTDGQTYVNSNGTCTNIPTYTSQNGPLERTKNDCQGDWTGSIVTYPARTYTSNISQADANLQRDNDYNNYVADAQDYANANGQCIEPYYNWYVLNPCNNPALSPVYTNINPNGITNQRYADVVDPNNIKYYVWNNNASNLYAQLSWMQSNGYNLGGSVQRVSGQTGCPSSGGGGGTGYPQLGISISSGGVDVPNNIGYITVNGTGGSGSYAYYIGTTPPNNDGSGFNSPSTLNNLPIISNGVYTAYYVGVYDATYAAAEGAGPNPIVQQITINATYTFTASKTGQFTKQCSSGYEGSVVNFSKDYTSTTSQADAEAAANANFNTEGQAYANANGTCELLYNWYVVTACNTQLANVYTNVNPNNVSNQRYVNPSNSEFYVWDNNSSNLYKTISWMNSQGYNIIGVQKVDNETGCPTNNQSGGGTPYTAPGVSTSSSGSLSSNTGTITVNGSGGSGNYLYYLSNTPPSGTSGYTSTNVYNNLPVRTEGGFPITYYAGVYDLDYAAAGGTAANPVVTPVFINAT